MERVIGIISIFGEFWKSLGPVGPCAALFVIGVLLILGIAFNWKWLYPSSRKYPNYKPGIHRVLTLVIGIILVICSIFFYIIRDSLYWL